MIPTEVHLIAVHLFQSDTDGPDTFSEADERTRQRYIRRAYALIEMLRKNKYEVRSSP